MQKDLSQGKVFATMSLFALPMLLGNVLQQAYNVVDTWVVGRFVGAGALAGVGSSFTLMTFLTSILLGLCMGSGVVFSTCFGRQDEAALKSSVGNSFVLALAVTAALTAVPLLCVDAIVGWLNTPAEIFQLTRDYLYIVFWGIPAIFLYNFFAAYLKAMGNSLAPLVFLGVSTALNIALDLLFVAVFGWGAAGAAQATVIAQYVAGAAIALYVCKKSGVVRDALRHLRPSRAGLRQIAGCSVFTCLQQSVMNLGILMVQGLVNSFGTTVMAAFAAAVKIDSFAYMPAQEYANAFSTFLAQNAGAGRADRVKQGVRCAFITSLSYCAAASLALWILAEPLMQILSRPRKRRSFGKACAICASRARSIAESACSFCSMGCIARWANLPCPWRSPSFRWARASYWPMCWPPFPASAWWAFGGRCPSAGFWPMSRAFAPCAW